jgi:hypothetical protein
MCLNCTNCTYCFGCINLDGEDFHILNQPFTREEYFKRLEELTAAFGID